MSHSDGPDVTSRVTRELSGPYRLHFVIIFVVLLTVASGAPLVLDGPVFAAPWVMAAAGATLLWRRARTRVLIDDEGVLLANTFQTHSFSWTQVLTFRADSNLVFTVRIPPYVDELTSSAVGSIGTVPSYVEQGYLDTVYQQLREYRAGGRPLEELGRPSRHTRDDAARWNSWRLDFTVFAVTAAAGPAVAGLLHSLGVL